ncbi:hypothetical protein [Salinivibrio sp. ML290]|uniref:hypothetical protein n=1 Tax=Salinivibrio sp. ML290 TaxID=1909468 RepID=UPI0009886758|nr:hypothetical protein [Salinivibrio sp. ML290]OOE75183.1 hypothetical protein BZG23_06145 [Salinivibrio sp. ML290]
MGVLLLAVALIAGYLFSSQHLSSLYRLSRTEGWHSYFYVASRGTVFSAVAAIFCFVLDYYDCISRFIKPQGVLLTDLDSLFLSVNDIKIVSWVLMTLSISYFSGLLSRLYYHSKPEKKDRKLQQITSENHLESFILEASFTQFPILVSLKSRKTYVGLCLGDELINGKVENLALIPYLSGYRGSEDLTFEDTTNYIEHFHDEGILDKTHGSLTINNFRVIIPLSEVESLAFFDLDTYIKFKKKELKAKNK